MIPFFASHGFQSAPAERSFRVCRRALAEIAALRGKGVAAFTLMELLVVVAIMGVMMALIAPAVQSIRGGNDFGSEVYAIAGVVDQARAYAMAND